MEQCLNPGSLICIYTSPWLTRNIFLHFKISLKTWSYVAHEGLKLLMYMSITLCSVFTPEGHHYSWATMLGYTTILWKPILQALDLYSCPLLLLGSLILYCILFFFKSKLLSFLHVSNEKFETTSYKTFTHLWHNLVFFLVFLGHLFFHINLRINLSILNFSLNRIVLSL